MIKTSNKSRYYYGLGIESVEKGEIEKALNFFKTSLEISPHFKTHHEIAKIYKKLGNESKALHHFASAYSLNSNNDKAAVDYAEHLYLNSEQKRAEEIVKKILERNQSYGPAKKLLSRFGTFGTC